MYFHRLESVMERRKVSREELARRLGLSLPAISKWLTMHGDVKLSTVFAWAKALGCKPRDLVLDEPASGPLAREPGLPGRPRKQRNGGD